MKTRTFLLLTIPFILLQGCSLFSKENFSPTSLTTSNNEIDLIVNSERDLNDLVTLNFEPNIEFDRSVVWTTSETKIFTLTDSTIKANMVGKGIVTATSVLNNELSVNIVVNVYDPISEKYSVTINESSSFVVRGLEKEYFEGSVVDFQVEVIDEKLEIDEVKMNGTALVSNNDAYSFVMPSKNVNIVVSLKKKPLENKYATSYEVKYDLGDRKTAKAIESNEELFNVFNPLGEDESIIDSISQFELIYGGANGGRSETAWYTGDILKIGSTSVTGSFTFVLKEAVSKIRITGYAYSASTKVKVGDALSTDWTEDVDDNKTTTFACSTMNVANKEIVENKQTSVIEIEFDATTNIKIATTTKNPIFITGVEFVLEE